jgi:hypothetical protein
MCTTVLLYTVHNDESCLAFSNCSDSFNDSNKSILFPSDFTIWHQYLTILYRTSNKMGKLPMISGSIQTKNKLKTYRKFKSIFKLEPYLLFGTKQQRKLLIKFRISAHNLNIKKGRYIGTSGSVQFCLNMSEWSDMQCRIYI